MQQIIQVQTTQEPAENKVILRDLYNSLRKALHAKHKVGQSNQNSLYFQMWDKVQPLRVRPHSDALWTMSTVQLFSFLLLVTSVHATFLQCRITQSQTSLLTLVLDASDSVSTGWCNGVQMAKRAKRATQAKVLGMHRHRSNVSCIPASAAVQADYS